METPCYRCNASIAEDAPFCPACGAPQIRVSSQAEPDPAPDPNPETPSPASVPTGTSAVPGTGEIQWKDFLRTAWPVAVLAGLTVTWIPLGFLILLPLSVAVGIWLYHKRRGGTLRAGQGAKLGMVMGFISFMASAALTVAGIASSAAARQEIVQRVTEAASRNPDPQAQQLMLSFIRSPQGFALFLVLLLVFTMFIFLVFTALSGAVAASTFGHKKR
jgi:hypothetical protein